MGEAIGKPSDPESCCCGDQQSCAAVRLESPLRTNRDDLVAIHELPGLGALHEGLMGDEFLRRLRRPMRFDIARARDELPIDRCNAPCEQVGVLKIANPDRAIIILRDEIDEAITVVGMDMKLGVASCHFREHGSEVNRAKRKRHGNSQAAAKLAGGQDCFPGQVDLGADSGCVVSKRDPGFCESGTAGGSCEELGAEFRFKPGELPTDD